MVVDVVVVVLGGFFLFMRRPDGPSNPRRCILEGEGSLSSMMMASFLFLLPRRRLALPVRKLRVVMIITRVVVIVVEGL